MGVRKGVRSIIGNEEMADILDELWDYGIDREEVLVDLADSKSTSELPR